MSFSTHIPAALAAAVEHFKTEMMLVELGIMNGKVDDERAQARVSATCDSLVAALEQHVQRASRLDDGIGTYVFRETFAILTKSANVDRWFAKPRGYAGDYYTIELVYHEQPRGEGRTGRFVDRWALDRPAAQAVRNRRALLAGAIRDVAGAALGGPALVTSLASGPAREVFDVLTSTDAPSMHATCIDIDNEAVAYASERARELGVADRVAFVQDNVIRLSQGRGKAKLPRQHMIYSVGLIDYLEDMHVVKLLDWIHDHLLPGGTVVVGNFDVENPDRAFLDHIVDWRLIHRTADDLHELFARSKFGGSPVRVRTEPQQINLFAFSERLAA
jgi:extracellular factor (EF) 3-hydroxypalmitic acid methyl ester biosynthesis protein